MLFLAFIGVLAVIAVFAFWATSGPRRSGSSSFTPGADAPTDFDHSSHSTHHADTSSHSASHDASHSDFGGGSHHH